MQFILTAYDGTDEKALDRRMSYREQHLKTAERMYREKSLLYAAAILDDAEKMIGSVLIVDFPSEEAIRKDWLAKEPYVLGEVWKEIKIEKGRVPGFCLEG